MESHFVKHLAKAIAEVCCTNAEVDWSPLVICVLKFREGTMFSMIAIRGGGVGWNAADDLDELGSEADSRKDSVGRGKEITEPRNEILDIHFDDNLGSNDREELCQ